MSEAAGSLLGIGLYSMREAARLLEMNTTTLGRWADGYTFPHRGDMRFSRPVMHRQLPDMHGRAFLTFLDLIELKFIALFRRVKVSMPVIRAAARRAAELLESDHPFAVRGFATDGKSIFVDMIEAGLHVEGMSEREIVIELHLAQRVFGPMVRPFLIQIEFGEREAHRWWPRGRDHRIVIDPSRAFGRPIDHQTSVPTFALYYASLSGASAEEVADWYEVPLGAVREAIAYEEGLAAA